jgi:hypothetical protein
MFDVYWNELDNFFYFIFGRHIKYSNDININFLSNIWRVDYSINILTKKFNLFCF